MNPKSQDTFYLQWHITNYCNLRCKHCYQYEFTKEQDLGISELKIIFENLLDGIKRFKFKKVDITLTGGEPFLRDDLKAIIDFLHDFEEVKSLSIVTNGLRIDEAVLRYSKVKRLIISLDGVNEEINDWIRGKGVFERVINGLRMISFKNIVFMYTLMKKNLQQAVDMIELVESLGVKGVIYEKFMPLGVGEKLRDEAIDGEDLKQFYLSMLERFGFKLTDDFLKYKALFIDLKDRKWTLKGAICVAGSCGVCVLPDGFVLPCRRFYVKIGNLLRDKFSDIWENSEVLNNIRDREKLKGKCRTCKIKDCYGCRAYAFCLTGDYLEEDLSCWK